MALDKIRLIVNKIRRLNESNKDGVNDSKLDDLYEELSNEIEKADIKVRLVTKVDKVISLNDTDNWQEWLIDNLIESEDDDSPTDIFTKDICDDLRYYVDLDSDVEVYIYNENGKEIYNNKN